MQIDVREYEQKYSQNSTQGEYDKEMKMYHCNTCGAELVADENVKQRQRSGSTFSKSTN